MGRNAEPGAVTLFLGAMNAGMTDQQIILLIAGQSGDSEYYNRVTA